MNTFSKSLIFRQKAWYWAFGILCLFFLGYNNLQQENATEEDDDGEEIENVTEILGYNSASLSFWQWNYSDQTNHKRHHFATSRRIHIRVFPKKPCSIEIFRFLLSETVAVNCIAEVNTFFERPYYYTHLFLYALF